MSFFSKLQLRFGGGNTEDLKVLEQGIGLLRLSTVNCLQKKYSPKVGPDSANALAVAVLSVMILEAPSDERFHAFYQQHRSEIGKEASDAHNYEEISGPSGCASYLYAAEILHSVIVKASYITDATKKWKSSKALEEQAANLGIYVPTLVEICGSSDRAKAIDAIHGFARAFYYTNTWIGASPILAEVPFPSIPHNYDFLSSMLLNVPPALPETGPSQKETPGDEMPSLYRFRLNN